jgi:hypothetical protein
LALAETYDLDYLISEQSLAFPEKHREGNLRVYALPRATRDQAER